MSGEHYTDEFLSVILSNPSVTVHLDRLHQDELKKASTDILRASANRSDKSPVVNGDTGLAIGFLDAGDEDAQARSISPGGKLIVKRSFKKSIDTALPKQVRLCELTLTISPDQLEGAKVIAKNEDPTHKTTAITKAIVKDGRVIDQDFVWEIEAAPAFHNADFQLTGSLQDHAEKRPVPTPEAISVPIPHIKLAAPPSPFGKVFGEVLDVLTKLFGVVGGIPTLILGFFGLRILRQRNRPENKDEPRVIITD